MSSLLWLLGVVNKYLSLLIVLVVPRYLLSGNAFDHTFLIPFFNTMVSFSVINVVVFCLNFVVVLGRNSY